MDEEQLRRLYEELQKAIEEEAEQKRVLGKVSKKTEQDLELLRTMILKSGKSLKDLTKATEDATKAEQEKEAENKRYVQRVKGDAAAFGKSVLGMAGAAGQGNTNFSILSGTVKSLSNAIGGLASAIPFVGKALDKSAQALGDGAAFVIGQLDKVGEAYQELGKVGAITTTGVDGLRQQFNELGTIGLPAFTKAIRENGQAVAALGSTTSRGTQMLGKSLGEVAAKDGPYLGPLLALGYSIDEITAIGSRYASMQVMMGNRNIKTTRDLTQAMVNYLKEIDEVARATGKSREQVDEENKKIQADVAFRAKMEELRASGQGAVADEMEAFARRVGGARADAFRATITGVPLTKEAQMATVLYGNTMRDTAQRLQQGGKAIDEHRRLAEAGGRGLGQMNKLLQVGVADQLGITNMVREQMDEEALMRRAREQGKDPFQLAAEERRALEDQLKGQKNLTKDFVDAQATVADFARNMQKLGFDFLPQATTAVKSFTNTLNDAVKSIRKGLGMAETAPTATGAPGGTRLGRAAARKRQEIEEQRAGTQPGATTGTPPGSTGAGLRGAAAKNLNPGNLRYVGQEGATKGTGGFAAFQSVDEGLVALANQINLYLTGKSRMGQLDTVASLIGVYAPPNENDTKAYVDKVARFMGIDPNAKIGRDPASMAKLMAAIIGVENFGDPVKGYNYRSGIQFAVAKVLGVDPSKIGKFARGGITSGPSIAGEAGPEAVVPLPNGKEIPVNFKDFSDSTFSKILKFGNVSTADFNNRLNTGFMQTDISDSITKIVQSNQPVQEALKSTIDEFRQAVQEFIRNQSGDNTSGMVALMGQLVDLQRNQNRTSERILQVSQN